MLVEYMKVVSNKEQIISHFNTYFDNITKESMRAWEHLFSPIRA